MSAPVGATHCRLCGAPFMRPTDRALLWAQGFAARVRAVATELDRRQGVNKCLTP